MSKDYSFFTYAEGKKYMALAYALARSYKLHNNISIPFCIAANTDFTLPWDLNWVQKIVIPQEVAGNGLEFKLHLSDISTTMYAIFIDADSLIYADISHLFSKFAPDKPSVVGLKVTDGTWVDEDIKRACAEFGLMYMIRYCGALYYLVKNEAGREIFNYANSLYLSGRKFQRNERTMYDEPILSIALSKYQVDPLPDDGNEWGDLAQFDYNSQLNVIKGPAVFNNAPGSNNYKFWLPAGEYKPKIVHVGSGNYYKKPWLFDALRLKFHYKLWLPLPVADLIVKLIVIPIYMVARKLFRGG